MEGLHRRLAPTPACSLSPPRRSQGRKQRDQRSPPRSPSRGGVPHVLSFGLPSTAMTPVVACLHHLDTAFTGHAGRAIRAAGVDLDERHVIAGDPLPGLDEIDGVLSLGGDQSVRDIASLPALDAEAAYLRAAVERGGPVRGWCLGAQLLAHALGGSVQRLPQQMLTWAPIEPLAA